MNNLYGKPDLKVGKYLWVFPESSFFEGDLTLVSTDTYSNLELMSYVSAETSKVARTFVTFFR